MFRRSPGLNRGPAMVRHRRRRQFADRTWLWTGAWMRRARGSARSWSRTTVRA
jgi:hypothetical protein